MMEAVKRASSPRVRERYEIKERIGQGGMGVVYEAKDRSLSRPVAIKTIRDAAQPGAIDRFRKEIEIIASLNDPNIVEIYDIGEFDEDGERKPFFVMPFLRGSTLEHVIRHAVEPLPADRALKIICQACSGLQAAHDAHLVHRDLKPSNIFLLKDDFVKIIDFGVARIADLGTTLAVRGDTMYYTAPEQLDSQQPSALSDQFSLAVVLYQTLTLRRPFDGDGEAEIAKAIKTHRPPLVSELNRDVSDLVSRAIHKALAKHPNHRFSSVTEFADTLFRAQRSEPIEIFDPVRFKPRLQRAAIALAQGDYQLASEILAELEADEYFDSEIRALRRQADAGLRKQLLNSVQARLSAGEPELARQRLTELLRLDPDNADAPILETRINDEFLSQAREHSEKRRYSEARIAAQQVLRVAPRHALATETLLKIDQAEKDYLQICKEKADLYNSAQQSWKNDDINHALKALERFRELDRVAPETGTSQRAAQRLYDQVVAERNALQQALDTVRGHLAEGHFMEAAAICDECLERHPGHSGLRAFRLFVSGQELIRLSHVEQALGLFRDAFSVGEQDTEFREELICSLLEDARNSLDLDPTVSQELVDQILRWDSASRQAIDLRERILERQREAIVTASIRQATQLQADGDCRGALGKVEQALSSYPNEPRLCELKTALQAGLQKALDESRTARARSVNVCLSEARRLEESGDLPGALAEVESGLSSYPDEPQLLELADRLRRSGREYHRQIDEFVTRCLAETRERQQAGDLLGALGHLRAGLATYPDEPRLKHLKDVVERAVEDGILSYIAQARQHQKSGDLERAVGLIEQGLAIYASEPRLLELQTVLRSAAQQAQARREKLIANVLSEVRQRESAGDLQAALVRIDEGLATCGNEPQLAQERVRILKAEQEIRRRKEELVLRCLNLAHELHSANDLERALAQIEQGLTSYPDDSRLLQFGEVLRGAIEDSRRKKEEFIRQCVDRCQELQSSGDLKSALAEVEKGLSIYPDDPELNEVHAGLTRAFEDARRKREDFVIACIAEAKRLEVSGDFKGALAQVRLGLAASPGDVRLRQLLSRLETNSRSKRRWRWGVACGLAVGIFGTIGYVVHLRNGGPGKRLATSSSSVERIAREGKTNRPAPLPMSADTSADAGTAGTKTRLPAEQPIPSSNGTVTIKTVPAGLRFTFDGKSFTAPRKLTCSGEGKHTLTVISPQDSGGNHHRFAGWDSGGNGQTLSIPCPSTASTYTASFKSQYLLAAGVSPAGAGTVTVNPTSDLGDGYYDSGTRVQIAATPIGNNQFSHWSGDISGSANPLSITMNDPRSVTAIVTATVTSPGPVSVRAFCGDPPDPKPKGAMLKRGKITWTADAGTAPGVVIICGGRAPKASLGMIRGATELPGVAVQITSTPPVTVTEPPSPADRWSRFAFQFDGKIQRIEFSWRWDDAER